MAPVSSAPTFGQTESRYRPVDSKFCYQQQAKAQHYCKTPCHKKHTQQSSLTVVKNVPWECRQGHQGVQWRCSAWLCRLFGGNEGWQRHGQSGTLTLILLPLQQLYFVHLHQFFIVLTILYDIIFNVFCHCYAGRIISIKRNRQGHSHFLGLFLSIYSSDQSTHYCNCSVTAISLLCHLPLC